MNCPRRAISLITGASGRRGVQAATTTLRLSLLFSLIVGLGACSRPGQPVARTWTCMGTFACISVPADEEAALDAVERLTRANLSGLDDRLSIFKPDSEISRLNRAAGLSAVKVSGDTEEVLRLSRHYAGLTGGAFDPTVAPLVSFWGFNKGRQPESVPGESGIRTFAEKVGCRNLSLSNGLAFLSRDGMSVDLGAIAKGYAVDVCFQSVATGLVRNLMINLGGNIRCRGEAAPGRPWSIGIRDPFSRERIIGTIRLSNGMAVATSGNYEKFVTIQGKRYAHIIDPRSGRPVEGVASVTVIATNAVEADAMSTAVFVMGGKGALPVLTDLPGCHSILIPDEQPTRVYMSPGARDHFTVDPSFSGEIIDMAAPN